MNSEVLGPNGRDPRVTTVTFVGSVLTQESHRRRRPKGYAQARYTAAMGPQAGNQVDGGVGAFLERARLEAERYGPDPWVFVRELLQNGRDAGATRVEFWVEQLGDIEQVVCLDDGEGMTFDHARRYLFALYASSKDTRKNQAGKFGVGFWSILRFAPTTIEIRSRPRSGPGWGVRLGGGLAEAEEIDAPTAPGTGITLQRPRGDGRLEHRVFDAVWQSGRYLHHRDHRDRVLEVIVNGRSANAEFSLPAPSASFRRRSVRGVVGLGNAPRVELFSQGLRVRAAACLEDLISASGRHSAQIRVRFPELPKGLTPQALLEGERIELLLSRSDARDDRALRRLVRLAGRELARLIDRQLALARPLPWWQGGPRRIWTALQHGWLWRALAGAVLGAGLALGLATWLWPDHPPPALRVDPDRDFTGAHPLPVAGPPPQVTPAFRDLGQRYQGPRIDVLSPASREPVDLSYEPADQILYLAALTFSEVAADGGPISFGTASRGPYIPAPCTEGCTRISVSLEGAGSPIRIPTPTGHRIDARTVSFAGQPLALGASGDGHPVATIAAGQVGALSFTTSVAADPAPWAPPDRGAPLPRALERLVQRVSALPIADRVQILAATVRRLVHYDRSPEAARRLEAATAAGQGFVARTLEVGAGDCDVQNGLLVTLLHAAGVPARLAVGFVGSHGQAAPWLHAWAEYRTEDRRWHVADASEGGEFFGAAGQVAAASQAGASPTGSGVDAGSEIQDASAAARPDSTVASSDTAEPAGGNRSAPAEPGLPPATPIETASESTRDAVPNTPAKSSLLRLALVLGLLVGGAWLAFARRTIRAMKLDEDADLSSLLQGVLQQPSTFGRANALFHRPLVPTCDDRLVSIHHARQLATSGRLYRTAQRLDLATQAIANRCVVLDDSQNEARVVGDALGATDLDRWDALIERSSSSAVLDRANDLLRQRRENWAVAVCDQVVGAPAVLDLEPLGVSPLPYGAPKLILLDPRDRVLSGAFGAADAGSSRAALLILDYLAHRLGLPEPRRSRLLSQVARETILEAYGP